MWGDGGKGSGGAGEGALIFLKSWRGFKEEEYLNLILNKRGKLFRKYQASNFVRIHGRHTDRTVFLRFLRISLVRDQPNGRKLVRATHHSFPTA